MYSTQIADMTTSAQRWFVTSYRHLQPWPGGNLYLAVRTHLELSQVRMAKKFGVSLQAWRYRERYKRMYHITEILALGEVSGLSTDEFVQLLKDVA